jgi:hypothetical protein
LSEASSARAAYSAALCQQYPICSRISRLQQSKLLEPSLDKRFRQRPIMANPGRQLSSLASIKLPAARRLPGAPAVS